MGRNNPNLSPDRTVDYERHLELKLSPELWRALDAYCAEKGAKTAHGARALLLSALRWLGHMPAEKAAEYAAELEDVFGYPWPTGPGPRPDLLVWWSKDPERPSWARLLREMEVETKTPLPVIARRFGVSAVHSANIFRRFDRWRRGEDPLAKRSLEPAPRKLPHGGDRRKQ